MRYPFGYGKTYSDFETAFDAYQKDGKIFVEATVKNIGSFAAREVIQVYFGAPCGKLGTPAKQLVAFKKTKELQPLESEKLVISFDINSMASYDDSGVTGNRFCYVLESGDYIIYAGTDIRSSSSSLPTRYRRKT